jgi:hypothetical protein
VFPDVAGDMVQLLTQADANERSAKQSGGDLVIVAERLGPPAGAG